MMGGIVRVVVVLFVKIVRSAVAERINGDFVAVILSSSLIQRTRHWEGDEAPLSIWSMEYQRDEHHVVKVLVD